MRLEYGAGDDFMKILSFTDRSWFCMLRWSVRGWNDLMADMNFQGDVVVHAPCRLSSRL